MLRIRAARGVSEAIRERETYKYDPTLVDDVEFNESGNPLPGSKIFTSQDTVLTCLAQLGSVRTHTGRSLISLFDQRWQYIIAEATPELPLCPDVCLDDLKGEDLWLSRTAIPRVHGVCNHTLVDPGSKDDPEAELPLTLASDLTSDPRFCKSPFCLPGSPARFYAAVPIRTPGGVNIGVYCVIHHTPRPISTWSDTDTEVIRNISRSIMGHLEYRSTKNIQRRSERMARGIVTFMEENTSLSALASERFGDCLEEDQQKQDASQDFSSPILSSVQEATTVAADHSSPAISANLAMLHRNVVSRTPSTSDGNEDPGVHKQRPPLDRSKSSYSSSSSGLEPSLDPDPHTLTKRIFTTAANIGRVSIETDGMVFVKAGVTGFGAMAESLRSRATSGDESAANSDFEGADVDCPVLGASAAKLPDGSMYSSLARHVRIPAKFLALLFRRYPKGMIFTYDEHGAFHDCDSSEDADQPFPSVSLAADAKPRQSREGNKSKSPKHEAEILSKLFQGARSVVFVPVRDDQKERWYAAGFAYTLTPTHVLSRSGELSYLQALATLVMASIHRVEIDFAHKAKSDVLSSLSHELRSPLHGVILSTELLADTNLDVFQGNILHTLETCGRTLLDTIDHLLDFSKINNYLKSVTAAKHARGHRQNKVTSIEAGMKSQYNEVNLDVLVEEVTESVFAGHYFQYMSIAQIVRRDTIHADAHANSQADYTRAMEDLTQLQDRYEELQLPTDNVSVHLDIDANESTYRFLAMGGAVRRIAMNLLGNALKYTEKGTIRISLSIDPDSAKSIRNKQRMVRLQVMDTGRGMSRDFLENDLYKPFHQADQLSPGTGLGLSLVKKIVTSLAGTISMESQLSVGTVVTVLLPLSPASLSATNDPVEQTDRGEMVGLKQALHGLRVRLIGFEEDEESASSVPGHRNSDNNELPLTKICREWLHMKIINPQSDLLAPDLIVCSETHLEDLRHTRGLPNSTPTVVVCSNALVAHRLSVSNNAASVRGVYEFISQPVGPRKLARSLSDTLRQWADRQSFPPSPKDTPLNPSLDCDSFLEQTSLLSTPRTTPESSIQTAPIAQTNNIEYMGVAPTTSKLVQTSGLNVLPYRNPSSSQFGASDQSAGDSEKPLIAPPSKEKEAIEFLLVDDNAINLRILSVYMRKLGRGFITAADGQEAVDKYKAQQGLKYIFMDISMPRLNGMEATRQIRAFEREQHMEPAKVFALSGLASTDVQEEAFSSGINLFLTKPVKLKELSLIVAQHELAPRETNASLDR